MHDSATWTTIRQLFEIVVDLPDEQAEATLSNASVSPAVMSEVRQLLQLARANESFLEDSINSAALSALDLLVAEIRPDGSAILANASEFSSLESTSSHRDVHNQESAESLRNAAWRKLEIDQQTAALQEEITEHFPNYEILQVLGRGGQGVVFLARDRKLGRDVALKVLSLRKAGNSLEQRPNQLLVEARSAAAIQHPNVATVYSVETMENTLVLATQFVAGENMKSWLSQRPYVPAPLAAVIASQIADGLQAAHEARVIHRDVKPANILLQLDEESETLTQKVKVKVVDFGLAVNPKENAPASALKSELNDLDCSKSTRRAGSLPYMSPEQWQGKDSTAASDIYALGVTLYQMITGRVPYVGSPPLVIRQILAGDPVPPRRINPEVPKDLESIVLKAMSLAPENRYRSAREMSEDLVRFQENRATLARPLSRWEHLKRWYHRDWKTAYSVTALATTLILATIVTSVLLAAVWKTNEQLVSAKTEANLRSARVLIDASPEATPLAIEELPKDSADVVAQLDAAMRDEKNTANQRFNAILGLTHLGDHQLGCEIAKQLLQLRPSRSLVAQSIKELRSDEANWQQALDYLRSLKTSIPVDNPNSTSTKEFNTTRPDQSSEAIINDIRAALLQFFLYQTPADQTQLATYCAIDADPTDRTLVMEQLPEFQPDLDILESCLLEANNSEITYTILCSLGLWSDSKLMETYSGQRLESFLKRLVEKDNSPAVISTGRWLAGQLNVNWNETWIKPDDRYREIEPNLHMIQIQPFRATHGVLNPDVTINTHAPHTSKISYAYYISDIEITHHLFQQFLNDKQDTESAKERELIHELPLQGQLNEACTTAHHPVTAVSWNAAAAFCNWLSRKHNRQPCYVAKRGSEVFPKDLEVFPAQVFVCDFSKNGFRLPSETEWEHATRAFTETEFYFGNDFKLAFRLLRFSSRRATAALPSGSSMPNPFGLHETIGNVWEWTNDWLSDIQNDEYTDYFGPDESSLTEYAEKTYRGGGVNTVSGEPSSHSRGKLSPENFYNNIGFRIVYRDTD